MKYNRRLRPAGRKSSRARTATSDKAKRIGRAALVARVVRRMKTVEIAEASGVSQSFVSDIENGYKDVTRRSTKRAKYLEFLCINPDDPRLQTITTTNLVEVLDVLVAKSGTHIKEAEEVAGITSNNIYKHYTQRTTKLKISELCKVLPLLGGVKIAWEYCGVIHKLEMNAKNLRLITKLHHNGIVPPSLRSFALDGMDEKATKVLKALEKMDAKMIA